jgi:hypothetical protein
MRIFLLAEQRGDDFTCRIINRAQEGEARTTAFQAGMITAIYLQ